MCVSGPGCTRQIFVYFAKKIIIILSSITKLQRRRRSALERDKLLSGVKIVQILQFAQHDLKKTFLSAPTITKFNWKFGRDKFCRDFLTGRTNFVSSVRPGSKMHGPICGSNYNQLPNVHCTFHAFSQKYRFRKVSRDFSVFLEANSVLRTPRQLFFSVWCG